MKETEITVQVYETKQDIHQKLVGNNFILVGHFVMEDNYFSKHDINTLKRMSYGQILKDSLIIRKCGDDASIIYKNKEIDRDNNVICEEKTSLSITDIKSVLKIFLLSGLNNWCNLTQEMYLYRNYDTELMVQIIEDLGIFIEYEEDESVVGLEPKEKINVMVQKLKLLGLNIGSDFSVKKVYQKFLNENNMKNS